MPAFTFEKLSPPAVENSTVVAPEPKQRGRVVQLLDRFVERRIQRTLGDRPHDEAQNDVR